MQRLARWRRVVAYRIGLLGTVAVILAVLGLGILLTAYSVPPLRGSALLQVLGAAILGAGLSALVGAVTGREAIRQQSARDANLRRKETLYGPLYDELKALTTAISEAKDGNAPAPRWIDDGIERAGIPFFQVPPRFPTLQWWPAFRRGYHHTDFKAATQKQLDTVQESAKTYNEAVEAARMPAIAILAPHVDTAIASTRQTPTYQQRQQQLAARAASPAMQGQPLETKYDWYSWFDDIDALGVQFATQWLTYWPSMQLSETLGWLLAGHPDKAAAWVQRQYPVTGGRYPPIPLAWIEPIFQKAWPDLQKDTAFCVAMAAGKTLVRHARAAEVILEDTLHRIREQYEGGEPLA